MREHAMEHVPDEGGRERKPHMRTDAQVVGQPKRQPAGHAEALDDDGLRDKWGVGWLADECGELIGEDFEPVAVMDGEHQ